DLGTRFGRGDRPAQSGAAGAEHQDVGLDRLVTGRAHAIHRGSCSAPAMSARMYTSVSSTEARLAQAQRSCRIFRTVMPLQSWNRARAEREQEKQSNSPPARWRNA